jgi:hypothetical protein
MPKKKPKQERRPDVPDDDHVARHCNPQRVIRNPITRAIMGVFPQAFELRIKINENYLSTHWMEFFTADTGTQFCAVVQALRDKGRDVTRQSAIARLNAGSVVNAGIARGHSIRIRDRSSPANPGYSGIYGMPPDNSDLDFLAALSSNECCIEVRGIAEIDAIPKTT